MSNILFLLVILLTNIIQGITGFAGTLLAMPPSIMLVGYNIAKPILNVLGILSGLYVFITHGKHVDWKEFKKVIGIMSIGIFGGIFLKSLFVGRERVLYLVLGCFVVVLSIQGFYRILKPKKIQVLESKKTEKVKSVFMLTSAGVVHGMFVSGGPLLIGYLSKSIKEKVSFRATISTIWIVLNTIILIDDIHTGLWNMKLIQNGIITIPFFIAGMVIGTKLYKHMSQTTFMKITYILLFVSGMLLIVK